MIVQKIKFNLLHFKLKAKSLLAAQLVHKIYIWSPTESPQGAVKPCCDLNISSAFNIYMCEVCVWLFIFEL